MAYKTIYTDPNGQKQTGYIINGTTYQDEGGTQAVAAGSTVTDASGRKWYKGANGSVEVVGNGPVSSGLPSAGGLYDTILANQEKAAQEQKDSLAAYQAAQDDLIRAKTDAAVEKLRGQVDPLNQGYDATKQQNYRAYVKSGNGLSEQLAAAGLGTSGAAESSRVALDTDYREGQNTVELQRQNALQSIEQQIVQAQLSGDYEAANTLASYYQQLAALQQQTASDGANALLTAYQLRQNEENTQYERQQAEKQWAWQTQQQGNESALQKAETLAAYGDFSGYKALGYTDAQIAQMKSAYQTAAQKASSGGSGSGVKAYTGLGDYAQTLLGLWQQNSGIDIGQNLKSALENGLISQQDYLAALQVAGAYGYGTQTPAVQQSTVKNTLTVDGYGEISYDDAERLEQAGLIRLAGTDGNGDPRYVRTAKKAGTQLALTR